MQRGIRAFASRSSIEQRGIRAFASPALSSQAVLHPMTNLSAQRTAPPMHIVRGEGVRVYDAHGREYLEAMAGLWCTSLGWGREELVQAAAEQMRELSYYQCARARSLRRAALSAASPRARAQTTTTASGAGPTVR